MRSYPDSEAILRHNRAFIPGGVVSVNRAVKPEIAFVKARGAYMWDAEGTRYVDYHAAFAAHFLGHNDPYVTQAVRQALEQEQSLFGSGTTVMEGRLAELICTHIPFVESIQLLNAGSEATYQAIRAARAVTGRDHIIVMQGGYNGWHNDVACNLMGPLSSIGPRRSAGEYPFLPISAGIPREHQSLVHPVNFNDLESVEAVCARYPIAALITEPILQNVGLIRPQPGYLRGLRALADRLGFLLIFDEVKTGFRYGVAGYAAIAGVEPDLVVYGKAVANGYPIAVLGGRKRYMDCFVDPDPARRVLLAGTYNAHPVPTAAAIATIERLLANDGEVYRHVEELGRRFEAAVAGIAAGAGVPATIVRQGSAFCIYFMDHAPVDYHDLAEHHNFALDERLRLELIERGVYFFPTPIKQSSICFAHTAADIDFTLECLAESLPVACTHGAYRAAS
jgi:glutamate-1-semialdehyde 2,1-aminomutase